MPGTQSHSSKAIENKRPAPTRAIQLSRRKTKKSFGTISLIGGNESKKGKMVVLECIARGFRTRRLGIITVGSHHAQAIWNEYKRAFQELGIKEMERININSREEAYDPDNLDKIKRCGALFFTGGDQLNYVSELGGTPICDQINRIRDRGGVVAGTSAGASILSDNMITTGEGRVSPRSFQEVQLGPGLSFLQDVIVDQHFAERGRIGRLVAAVAQNPRFLGLGIDEDTACVFRSKHQFEVIGNGSVYVLDARKSTDINVLKTDHEHAKPLFNLKLHVLSSGSRFDLKRRIPH